ncbi:MAG: FAD-dependent oxidoreductase [Leptolyngbyaceae cyanobacterium SM2_5_2]|nr:FAD-dependent oxidoreductase [Leptolyngbyaceae cyanobacterium SM2_5_2]
MWDVVVVGAGLSGLTAAQALRQAGYGVLVLDKSRGVGGRVATRRVGEVPVDHGCRFVQPAPGPNSTLMADGLAAGGLQPWTPLEFDLSDGDLLLPRAPSGLTTLLLAA